MTEQQPGDAFTKATDNTPEPSKFDVDAWLAGAKPATKTLRVSNKPGILAQIEDLEDELTGLARKAAENNDTSLADSTEWSVDQVRVAKQIKALLDELDGSWANITVRALSMDEFQEAMAAGDGGEDPVKVAIAGLAKAAVHPTFTPEQLRKLHDVVGAGQFGQLWSDTRDLSVRTVVTPDFSPAVSSILDGLGSSKS